MGIFQGNLSQAERAARMMRALSSLCADGPANQLAVAKAGGVPPLILWLDTDTTQMEAAHALLTVAADNSTTQALVVSSERVRVRVRWPRQGPGLYGSGLGTRHLK